MECSRPESLSIRNLHHFRLDGQNGIYKTADMASYQYDNNGNTVSETKNGQTTAYGYNSANRLETVNLPDGRIATYTYDPFGRRIKKDIAGLVTYYVYSDEGLIGEYDSTGNLNKTYGWRPDSIWGTGPVFMAEGGNYYFYHNDTLGTPQRLTDINGTTVWSATYTAFGEATVNSAAIITNNLRFPGQYYDEETGLHYNWNRYYNPVTGRYTQVDPIGFAAGDENLYRYVGNGAIRFKDPLGFKIVVEHDSSFNGDRGSYQEAITYLSQDTGMSTIIRDLETSSTIYKVVLTGESEAYFDPASNQIVWNPNLAVLTSNGGKQSPALVLGHELAHADAPWYWKLIGWIPIPWGNYDFIEEWRVITGPEADAASTLGECRRYDHRGSFYRVKTPKSR